MILIFDTGTTGLNPYKDDIKQLAWQVYCVDGSLQKECNFVGNITEAIKEFQKDVERSHYFVGHNADFDIKMLMKHLSQDLIKKMQNQKICTIRQSAEWFGVETADGYKFPKLSELYQKLFGEDFENAHQALADTQACASCFFGLLELGIITLKKIPQ
jgi:DNA polymerase III epsilon subunit-like protein